MSNWTNPSSQAVVRFRQPPASEDRLGKLDDSYFLDRDFNHMPCSSPRNQHTRGIVCR